MPDTDTQPLTPRRILLVIATGVGAGFLSGLFGVGGGLVIVPALMAVLRMDQRRASATSLAAIIVTAAVGSGTYALHGASPRPSCPGSSSDSRSLSSSPNTCTSPRATASSP